VSIDALSVGTDPRLNQAAALFGESASRVVVSTARDHADDVLARAAAKGVPARVIGETGGVQLRISVGGELAIDVSVIELERIWTSAIDRYFIRRVA
jgi:phosphoribosylformylglycinamidine synthase